MIVPTTIGGCLLLLAGLFMGLVFSCVWHSWSAGLDRIPGPWLARYTNFWAVYRALRIDDSGENPARPTKTQHYRALKERYGDFVRTGPRTVTILNSAVVPYMYNVRAKMEKGDAYIPFRQPGVTTSLLSIRDDNTHGQYRRLVANAYSMSAMSGYEPAVDQMITRWLDVFEQHTENGHQMNLSLWAYYYCIDTVSKVTTGDALGFMDGSGKDVFGLLEGVHAFGAYVGPVAQAPWLHYVLKDNFIFRKTKPSPFHKAIRDAVERRLKEAEEKPETRSDLLSHFADAHRIYPNMMTARQATIQAGGNLIAGALSPGKTFDCLFKWLALNSKGQDALFKELAENNVTVPASFYDTKDLPYLAAVIREAERLHTAASMTLERVTGPSGFDLPGGVHLPPGINIGCSIETTNSDPRIYGVDSDEFNPSRWLRRPSESKEAFTERMRIVETTNLTFGQGSRTCIGKNIFKLEAFKAVASIMLKYKLEAISVSGGEDLFVHVCRR